MKLMSDRNKRILNCNLTVGNTTVLLILNKLMQIMKTIVLSHLFVYRYYTEIETIIENNIIIIRVAVEF